MNKFLTLFFLWCCISLSLFSQGKQYNQQANFVARKYDLVAYFEGSAIKGKKEHRLVFQEQHFQFSSAENLIKFQSNPEYYLPQYGGWCAYGMAQSGKKYRINPKSFEIRDGKLYLFYRSFFLHIYEKWLKKDPEQLIIRANKNWIK